VRERVRRIDQIVPAALATPSCAPSALVMRCGFETLVEAEAAFDAEPALVGRTLQAGDRDQLVVLDLIK